MWESEKVWLRMRERVVCILSTRDFVANWRRRGRSWECLCHKNRIFLKSCEPHLLSTLLSNVTRVTPSSDNNLLYQCFSRIPCFSGLTWTRFLPKTIVLAAISHLFVTALMCEGTTDGEAHSLSAKWQLPFQILPNTSTHSKAVHWFNWHPFWYF